MEYYSKMIIKYPPYLFFWIHTFGNLFRGGAIAYDDAHYGEGSGDIFMDDVQCVGTETNIGQCFHVWAGFHNCEHDEDAGVWCSPGLYETCH